LASHLAPTPTHAADAGAEPAGTQLSPEATKPELQAQRGPDVSSTHVPLLEQVTA
jgi:hypothetical protein